ncbi:hypothetical protein CK203_029923 [Vitis vinifera]|uniref:PGG domain-containing protein n=1 Tax=Vitis vinifera TaxID=29760 RepID=A0A438IDJ0_VITVI|nr:hypothetical protein CK203_029923 [Vitis vinifera]
MRTETPLCNLAAAKLHSSIVSTLIQTGNVDTTTINKKCETALDIARKFQLVSSSNEVNEGTDGNQAQATPNETGCAGDERIEAKSFHLWPPLLQQRTIEILKAASAKQAKKLEGILEQEYLIIESIRDKRRKEMAGTLIVMATLVAIVTFTTAFTLPRGVQSEDVMDVTCLNGTGIPYWTVHYSIKLNGACYRGSQESNTSNRVGFGAEMRKIWLRKTTALGLCKIRTTPSACAKLVQSLCEACASLCEACAKLAQHL